MMKIIYKLRISFHLIFYLRNVLLVKFMANCMNVLNAIKIYIQCWTHL